MDAVERRAQRLLPDILAAFMSAFVAAVVTFINTGFDAGYPAPLAAGLVPRAARGHRRRLPVPAAGVAAGARGGAQGQLGPSSASEPHIRRFRLRCLECAP